MSRKKNSILDAVTALLDDAGAEYRIEQNKHPNVYWSLNGYEFIIVVAATASDHRAKKNALARVRRQLREAGHAV